MSFQSEEVAHQYVPDVLTGSLVAAEANAGAQQALSPPHVTGHHLQLSHPGGFGAVHLHPHSSLHVGFQELLQLLVFLTLAHRQVNRNQNRDF